MTVLQLTLHQSVQQAQRLRPRKNWLSLLQFMPTSLSTTSTLRLGSSSSKQGQSQAAWHRWVPHPSSSLCPLCLLCHPYKALVQPPQPCIHHSHRLQLCRRRAAPGCTALLSATGQLSLLKERQRENPALRLLVLPRSRHQSKAFPRKDSFQPSGFLSLPVVVALVALLFCATLLTCLHTPVTCLQMSSTP